MAVSVTLPKLGESVTEGTIIRWLKQEGERVEEDELLFEISTDKIDTEVPSPAAGVLSKILVGPDQTVEVGTEIALIDETGSGASAEGARRGADETATEASAGGAGSGVAPTEAQNEATVASLRSKASAGATPAPASAGTDSGAAREDGHAGVKGFVSPLVRKLARERGIDLSTVRGSGAGGRITKEDVLGAGKAGAAPAPAAAAGRAAPAPGGPRVERQRPAAAPAVSAFSVPDGAYQDVAFDHVRRAIAEHMSRSRQTAADVTNVIEVDMTSIVELRGRAKEAFERAEGFKLTYMPFIASAVVQALRTFPELNAHILDGKTARLFRAVNLGIAVGRDEGLIVPVVHGADGMNLVGLARAIHDVGTRARAKGGLKPDDVTGGTFTITNYGSFGGVIDTPIIAQPQIAILGIGAIVKRPAVIAIDGADAIAVRHIAFLSLSYDHRWIDGHRAAQFNGRLKELLEETDFAHELGL